MALLDLRTPQPSYADTHKATVMILNMLGLKLNPRFRLEPFKLIRRLDTEFRDRPETEEARKLIARLVILRLRGLEPPHKNGQYLPRSLDDLTI